jgi:hypothetical protein
MFLNVYNCIIFDEEMDLISCLNNEYLCAALTEQEMTVIVPLIADLMSCETLGEFLIASDSNTEFLMDECHVSEKMIENWSENKLSEYEKFSLAFQIASSNLENMRYHTCQVCGADYFSKETYSDVCEECAADIYKNFWC